MRIDGKMRSDGPIEPQKKLSSERVSVEKSDLPGSGGSKTRLKDVLKTAEGLAKESLPPVLAKKVAETLSEGNLYGKDSLSMGIAAIIRSVFGDEGRE